MHLHYAVGYYINKYYDNESATSTYNITVLGKECENLRKNKKKENSPENKVRSQAIGL